jgi:two-component system chemotaxis sensor kinase CheA
MDTAKYADLFVAEGREHLAQCTRGILAWERAPHDPAPVGELFRAVHTLKGMAAALGHTRIANLAHAFEHVLVAARDGHLVASPDLMDVALRTVDALSLGVSLAAGGSDTPLEIDPLILELGRLSRPETGTWPIPVAPSAPEPAASAEGVAIRVRLRPGVVMPGARALLVLRQAEMLGVVRDIRPPVAGWITDTTLSEFTCRVATSATDGDLRTALRLAGDVEEVAIARGPGAGLTTGGPRQVRVGMDRLDRLVTLVGEVAVARTRVVDRLGGTGDVALQEDGYRLARLVSELQEQVLLARMAPVAEVFDRFPRVVRDLGRQLGKQVQVELEGGDIELDRALLDQLPDILLHLIRNAVDHGIESPEARAAAGKPAEGRLRLAASREGDAVLVEVEDDGRGIDRKAVLAKARAEGWVADGEADLAADTLLRVLARPGFSTAERVTEVSGRGVGIDAVVHRVRALGGATELGSRPGTGTSIRLRLPLTVAIVPALLVGVGDSRYAVPLAFVAEAARLEPGDATAVMHRGRRLPRLDLGGRRPDAPWRPGLILDVGGRLGALVVDTLLGREDIVVGPVDAPRGTPRWINGATILSDGRPALVVDPAALV